ncbi:MAG: HAD-IC family P-type ATPase [Ruminococcus sp.]|nr:HAD-IC family P-type ATPase [Ruminococcus sp.]
MRKARSSLAGKDPKKTYLSNIIIRLTETRTGRKTKNDLAIGKSVVRYYCDKYDKKISAAENFSMFPGKGVSAAVGTKKILAGNADLLFENGINADTEAAEQYLAKGATAVHIAIDGKSAGFLALADALRPQSGTMLEKLRMLGVQPVLLTGNTENAASTIAEELKISEICPRCLPEDKMNYIVKCQENCQSICMIGDGINDAPVLKQADVRIAMGGIGSDIAVDAADIALIDDKVEELSHLFELSKHMMTTIKFNLTFSVPCKYTL